MPIATLRYRLPDEQAEYDAARLGSKALSVLWHIDHKCRCLLKHGQPTDAEQRLADRIREMIDADLLEQ